MNKNKEPFWTPLLFVLIVISMLSFIIYVFYLWLSTNINTKTTHVKIENPTSTLLESVKERYSKDFENFHNSNLSVFDITEHNIIPISQFETLNKEMDEIIFDKTIKTDKKINNFQNKLNSLKISDPSCYRKYLTVGDVGLEFSSVYDKFYLSTISIQNKGENKLTLISLKNDRIPSYIDSLSSLKVEKEEEKEKLRIKVFLQDDDLDFFIPDI